MNLRRTIGQAAFATGFNPVQFANFVRGLPHFYAERREFKRQWRASHPQPNFEFRHSISLSGDRYQTAGAVKGHYFNQDLFVAKQVFKANPARHVDVGSRIDGFIAHIASFRTVDVLDIRPLESPDDNITFHQVNILDLDSKWFESTDSLSCLHALEHFGLGRYGDPVDVDGWFKGLEAMTSMLKPRGVLYLSVPTGLTQRVEFNAQRVFSLERLYSYLNERFEILSINVISNSGSVVAITPFEGQIQVPEWLTENDCSMWQLRRHE